MKRLILTTLMWSTFGLLMGQFQVGSSYALYGDQVRLRDAPGSDGNTLGLLPIGARVEVLSLTEPEQIGELVAPWARVRWAHDGTTDEGYLFAAWLAVADVSGDFDDDSRVERALISVPMRDPEHLGGYLLRIRVLRDGEFIDEWSEVQQVPQFEEMEAASLDLRSSLVPGATFLQLDVNLNVVCRYRMLFTMTGGKVKKMLSETIDCSEGDIIVSGNFIWPHEEGGVHNHLKILRKIDSGVEENSENDREETTLYKWNGTRLVQQ